MTDVALKYSTEYRLTVPPFAMTDMMRGSIWKLPDLL